MIKVPVSISTTIHAGVTSHFAPIPPIPNLALEGGLQYWVPGFFINQNRFTFRVKHNKSMVVLAGHDVGMMMFHLTIPIYANPWYIRIYPGASRKITFFSSTVKMEGQPVGCSYILLGLPMLTCGEPVSTPTAFSVSNFLCTARVGLVPLDILAGVASIAVSMIIDVIFNKLWVSKVSKSKADKILEIAKLKDASLFTKLFDAKRLKQAVSLLRGHMGKWGLSKYALKEYLVSLLGSYFPTKKKEVLKWVVKRALTALTGFATSSINGDPTFKLKVGHDAAGLQYQAKWQKDGTWKHKGKGSLGPRQATTDGETGGNIYGKPL